MVDQYWKIGDFAKKINKHTNTVDGWFRKLEVERKLHYISRVNEEKVYDELDLEIAEYITEKRDNKWSLNAIFDSLPEQFSLRPFPTEYEQRSKEVQVVDVEKMRATIMSELKTTFEQMAASQLEQQMSGFQKMLPSPEEKRQERLDQIIVERKVTRMLEEEALALWSSKSEGERTIRAGLFGLRKEEDRDKRDRFVKEYTDKHFEDYIKKEFGMD